MNTKVEQLFSVKGKVVALTGAGGVLYGNIARALAANGAKVALLDILKDKVVEIANEIKGKGGAAVGVECNVLDQASVEAALAIKPKIAVPMHYGAVVGAAADAQAFKEALGGKVDGRILSKK